MIDWPTTTRDLLKRELDNRSMSYSMLAKALIELGVKESNSSISSKISRGTFSAQFLIQCLYAIECNELTVNNPMTMNCDIIAEKEVAYRSNAHGQVFDHKDGKSYIDVRSGDLKISDDLKVISLFSGAGGLDIGLEHAGFKTICCIENDIHCRETLRFNRPDWKLFESSSFFAEGILNNRAPGDIRNIGVEELLEFANVSVGDTTLVVGGAPCQPFSNIGKKHGAQDEKHGDLFLEFVRIVKGVSPKGFIFENVAGITQSRHSSVLKYMIDNFSGSGYKLSYTTLNAANYGVPQKRNRFFLIGIRADKPPAFPLPTHFRNVKSWELFASGLNKKIDYTPKPWNSVQNAFDSLPNSYKNRPDYTVMNCSPKVVNRMTYIEQGENFKVLPMSLRPDCWKNGKHQGQDTFGRIVADQPSVTIRTSSYNPSKGRYIHPFENRGLNTIEMAVLQDFPKGWQFKSRNRDKVTLVSAGKQIGNAVPPGLARALGIALRKQF